MKRNGILTGLIAVCAACVITAAAVCSRSPRTSNTSMKTAMATINLDYICDVDSAIEFYAKVTEQLAGVRYLSTDARAAVYFYTTHLSFAIDLTAGRARSLVGTVVGLISLGIGGVALARAAGRIGTGNGRTAAIVAVVFGLIGVVLSVVHLGSSTGGFGTGSGRAGAIVALVLGLIGINLGGLALARSRRPRSTD